MQGKKPQQVQFKIKYMYYNVVKLEILHQFQPPVGITLYSNLCLHFRNKLN